MAKPKCTLTKAKGGKAAPAKKATATPDVVSYQILDSENGSFTVQGVDAGGAVLDISAIATLTVTSADPTTMSVSPPIGMTVAVQALRPTAPGTPLLLSFTATFTDGSVGPFTITQPCDISGSAATGLLITPGTPTIR